ncbi:oxygen-independent coproporphyrinogen III oxidase [Kushneria aurantia]|uniref:Coproporphyrinogen-III oxidase n=1 Tax=Kushneria aurantia TaxID=504092 RepID=A0ABV6G547_9GAMM|nr:oxygen-independent coproporphyrinogen III oxidase [Kushneria aurantia]
MSHTPIFDRALVSKYDFAGPRYTSYPTAPQFHDAFTLEDYRHAAAAGNATERPAPLSVYVHIPFCDSLCYYCACNKIVTRRAEKAARYLDYLKREMALQAELFDDRRPLTQLHLGGGTPTFFSDAQLAELLAALNRSFRFAEQGEREFSIEVDPRTVTPERIRMLHMLGFNRLSLGIQDFDPEVQAAVNRVQGEDEVRALFEAARAVGFDSISVDLIYGLPLQSVASFDATLTQVIALRPDRIATYSYAHLPEMFRAQRLIRPEQMPPPQRKLELLELTVQRLTAAGYDYIGMDHFALPEDELTRAREAGTLQRNFQGYSTHADCDLIGLGVSAIGRVGDSYSQNAKALVRYYASLDAGRLPIRRGYRLNDDDRLRREVIMTLMCHGHIDMARVEARHGIDFEDYFAEALAQLGGHVADGLVTLEAHRVVVKPRGRLMMRSLAMAFDAYLGPRQRGLFSRIV